ncbi:hypothetical protein TBLA_0F01030 [Henningerozyma blattae CBS 6284]|uniref:Derlin n=1 Tax=Henningerozyma blattae (strain ATCC 34711 / CBS 6284 / DSM 70876 / NBRC 10599 / NRRL Y-10934 / UCD 77-7) TaxID=1071380 RepID=I2H5J4_HENB6|nr:hypothetical protein TBLA_0F01030 [Tetrapisispora blattae CBS 6284]CCH61646.1 hypothetical protein TBLA_0F01030 [Tetrapisispora blattae CBS 6284]
MSMETPNGLVSFPVTKLLMIGSIVLPLAASVMNSKYLFILHYEPFISQYGQYWRMLTFQLSAINESDVILIVLIWYHFRNLERLMGSYKYICVIVLALIYTTVILSCSLIILNILTPWMFWNRLTTGPLPILLSLLHFYKEYTPRIYEFNILLARPWFKHSKNHLNKEQIVWKLNDQFILNAYILLLLLNQGIIGVSIGFTSWICGILIDQGLLPGINSFRLPFVKYLLFLNRNTSTFVSGNLHTNQRAQRFNDETNTVLPTLTSSSTRNSLGLNRYNTDTTNNNANNSFINSPVPQDANHVFRIDGGSSTNLLGDTNETINDEPPRPLGVQFLDTFRR